MKNQISTSTAIIVAIVCLFVGTWVGVSAPDSKTEKDLIMEIQHEGILDSLKFDSEAIRAGYFFALDVGARNALTLSFIKHDTKNVLSDSSLLALKKVDGYFEDRQKVFHTLLDTMLAQFDREAEAKADKWLIEREKLTN